MVRQGGRGRSASPLPRRHPGPGPPPGRVRDRGDRLEGVRRVFPCGRRLHQLGQGPGHPGRPGPWFRRRVDVRVRDADHRPGPAAARPDLRALPEPRTHVDARLRHRLRRPPPPGGDPLRHREVRRRPGRDDRHLRHHQGQAGGQGRRPGARLPVRDGGPDHQGDAADRDGQGRPAGRDLRHRAQAVLRGDRVPRAVRIRRRRRARSSTPLAAWRTSSASGACTRPASSCPASR